MIVSLVKGEGVVNYFYNFNDPFCGIRSLAVAPLAAVVLTRSRCCLSRHRYLDPRDRLPFCPPLLPPSCTNFALGTWSLRSI